ncbi:jg26207 [Pararge aegeria aegeria]|uniref:Jg26207 protein n=1 Tax=Pararge aegeria aegeria TaxID=348720 RepID=A0A8S4SEF1_9NEOP|nr:jg26207 [Pararge aegeria aegeria]
MCSNQTPSPPPPPNNTNTTCKDDNIKVFEFCELIKDPEDDTVSIVKETFTEEVITTPEGSVFGKPTHNRYRYCREVIQPFCKAHTTACPRYPTHRVIPFQKSLSNTSQSSKIQLSDSGVIIMSPNEKKTFDNPSISSIKSDGKKRPCPPPLPRNEKKECQKEESNCETYSKCPQYKDEASLKEYLSSCLSTTITMAKKASATCLEKCEKTIGVKQPKCGEEKPTYYVIKKPKSKDSVTDNRYENILSSDIVQSFKSGVKGIVDTVINKTKETASMFTSGSCKDLQQEKDRKTKDCENKAITNVVDILPNIFKSQDDSSKNSTLTKIKSALTLNSQDHADTKENSSITKITSMLPNPSKSHEDHVASNKNSFSNITSFLTDRFKSKEDTNSESLTRIKNVLRSTINVDNNPDNSMQDKSSLAKMLEPAVAAIERVTSALSSTASTTLSTVKGLSMTDIINSRLDSSSPEDDTNINRRASKPSNITLEHKNEPNDSPSMFTMLKTKFYSMFADDKEETQDENASEDQPVDKL